MLWIKVIRLALVAVGLSVLWWCADTFLVSQETQIQRAQAGFENALEARKWTRVEQTLSAAYEDDWGQNRAQAMELMKHLLGGFIILDITSEVREISSAEACGQLTTRTIAEGTGAGLSNLVTSESKKLKEPWIIHWRKSGGWPWSWEITKISNAELAVYKRPKDLPSLP